MSDHLPSVTIVRESRPRPPSRSMAAVLTLTHERLPLAYRPGL